MGSVQRTTTGRGAEARHAHSRGGEREVGVADAVAAVGSSCSQT